MVYCILELTQITAITAKYYLDFMGQIVEFVRDIATLVFFSISRASDYYFWRFITHQRCAMIASSGTVGADAYLFTLTSLNM